MRLEPIERPKGLFMRLAYWMSRRQLGAVISPLKVGYARAPRIGRVGWAIARTLDKLSLDRELVLLVTTQSSLINGCTFCADLHHAQAVQERIGLDKFRDLEKFRDSPRFSPSERAALAYTEEVTRTRDTSDATFAALREHFDDTQIFELTWLNAVGNYFNLMAVPLGLESDGLTEMALARAS
ncbi:MAG: carboxymuconolactone decarboxylase family protein [Myxococcota bacterium]